MLTQGQRSTNYVLWLNRANTYFCVAHGLRVCFSLLKDCKFRIELGRCVVTHNSCVCPRVLSEDHKWTLVGRSDGPHMANTCHPALPRQSTEQCTHRGQRIHGGWRGHGSRLAALVARGQWFASQQPRRAAHSYCDASTRGPSAPSWPLWKLLCTYAHI